MKKRKTSPSPSHGGGTNLLPLGEIREGFLCLLFGLLLVGCQSRQQQVHEVASDFDKAKEEQSIRQLVDDVYKDVNIHRNGIVEPAADDLYLEGRYTTKAYQAMYDSLHKIEVEKYALGKPNDAFFAAGGSVWTMGSLSLPFTTEVVKVVVSDSQTAEVYFNLKPNEGDEIHVIWEMKREEDQWRIQDFIQADENFGDYYYSEQIKDYIQRNTR